MTDYLDRHPGQLLLLEVACLVGLWVTWRGRGILVDAVRRP